MKRKCMYVYMYIHLFSMLEMTYFNEEPPNILL